MRRFQAVRRTQAQSQGVSRRIFEHLIAEAAADVGKNHGAVPYRMGKTKGQFPELF
jgi:hypothetical protein